MKIFACVEKRTIKSLKRNLVKANWPFSARDLENVRNRNWEFFLWQPKKSNQLKIPENIFFQAHFSYLKIFYEGTKVGKIYQLLDSLLFIASVFVQIKRLIKSINIWSNYLWKFFIDDFHFWVIVPLRIKPNVQIWKVRPSSVHVPMIFLTLVPIFNTFEIKLEGI